MTLPHSCSLEDKVGGEKRRTSEKTHPHTGVIVNDGAYAGLAVQTPPQGRLSIYEDEGRAAATTTAQSSIDTH
jgi:hypothetical protein